MVTFEVDQKILRLNHRILDVAMLRLRFCPIAATKSNPNLSATLSMLFEDRPYNQLYHC
jgi:hypothetical protein